MSVHDAVEHACAVMRCRHLGKLLQKPVPATPKRLEALQGPLLLTPKANGIRALLVCEGTTAVLSLAGGVLLPLAWTVSAEEPSLLCTETPSIYDGEFCQNRQELWLFDLLAYNGQDWRGAAPRERLAKLSTLLPHGLTCLSVQNTTTTLVVQIKPVFEASNGATARLALEQLDMFVNGGTAPPTDGILIQEAAVPFLAPLKHKTWPTIDVQLVFDTKAPKNAPNTVPMVCVRSRSDGSHLCPLMLHGHPVTLCTPLPPNVQTALGTFVADREPPPVIVEGVLVVAAEDADVAENADAKTSDANASQKTMALNKEDVAMSEEPSKIAFWLQIERLRPDRTGPNTEADCLDVATLVANGWHTRAWLEHALMVERWGARGHNSAAAQKRSYTHSVTESVPWELWHQLWVAVRQCRTAPSFTGAPVPLLGALPSTWVHELWRLGARYAYVPPHQGWYVVVIAALACNEETRPALEVLVRQA